MPSYVYLALDAEVSHSIHSYLVNESSKKECLVFGYGCSCKGNDWQSNNIKIFNIDDYRTGEIECRHHYNNSTYEKLYRENMHIIHRLITRQQLQYGDLSYDSVENLGITLKNLAAAVIIENDVQFIFSKSYPQFAFDFCLLLFAKAREIRFVFEGFIPYFNRIVFQEAYILNATFGLRLAKRPSGYCKTDTFISGVTREIVSNTLVDIIAAHSNPPNKSGDAYISFSHYLEHALRLKKRTLVVEAAKELASKLIHSHSLSDIRVKFARFRIKNSDKSYKSERITILNSIAKTFYSRRINRRLIKEFNSSIKNKDAFSGNEIFYFATQEPEASLLVHGGTFNSNILAIDALAAFSEGRFDLVYKEQMSSFLPNRIMGTCTEPENKNPIIYEYIDKIENAYVIDPRVSKYKMMMNNSIFASICGTIGFEASLMGKKSFLFSNTWYSEANHPNVQVYGNWDISSEVVDIEESTKLWADFLVDYLQVSTPVSIDGVLLRVERGRTDYLRMFDYYCPEVLAND